MHSGNIISHIQTEGLKMQFLLISIQHDPLLGATTALRGPANLILCFCDIWRSRYRSAGIEYVHLDWVKGYNHAVKRDAADGRSQTAEPTQWLLALPRARNDSTGKLDYKCYICTADCILSGGSMAQSGRPGPRPDHPAGHCPGPAP
jgi:hypothetical protein